MDSSIPVEESIFCRNFKIFLEILLGGVHKSRVEGKTDAPSKTPLIDQKFSEFLVRN